MGLQFNWKGWVILKHTGLLEGMLHELSQAPLKPHQRLKILKSYLVPKFTHELVLGHAHRNMLVRLDRLVRSALCGSGSAYQVMFFWGTSTLILKTGGWGCPVSLPQYCSFKRHGSRKWPQGLLCSPHCITTRGVPIASAPDQLDVHDGLYNCYN